MTVWFSTLGRPMLRAGLTAREHCDGRPLHDPDAHGGWFCAPPIRLPELDRERGASEGETNPNSDPAELPQLRLSTPC